MKEGSPLLFNPTRRGSFEYKKNVLDLRPTRWLKSRDRVTSFDSISKRLKNRRQFAPSRISFRTVSSDIGRLLAQIRFPTVQFKSNLLLCQEVVTF